MAAFLGGLVAGAAKKYGAKVVSWGSKQLGRRGAAASAGAISGVVRRTAGAAAGVGATVGTAVAVDKMMGGGGSSSVFGLPLVTDPFAVETLRAPRGYVLIQNPESDDPEDKIAVLKEVAYALKLRKRPTRGGITASEIRAARRVQSVIGSLTVARKPRFALKKGRRR